MWPNPQETADLVTFTEEVLNGKLHFLYSVGEPLRLPRRVTLLGLPFVWNLVCLQVSLFHYFISLVYFMSLFQFSRLFPIETHVVSTSIRRLYDVGDNECLLGCNNFLKPFDVSMVMWSWN